MTRFGKWSRRGSRLVAAAGVVCLAVGPETIGKRIETSLVAGWKSLGRALADRDLANRTSDFNGARADLQRVQAQRDALAIRLGTIEMRRKAANARSEKEHELFERISMLLDRLPEGNDRTALQREAAWHQQRNLDANREIAQLDAATAALADEIAQVDRSLQTAHDRLHLRESELVLLRAADEARQLRQQLADIRDPSTRWNTITQADRTEEPLEPFGSRHVPLRGNLATLNDRTAN